MTNKIKKLLAPKGHLRVGINMSNFLLVVGKDETGNPIGISPDIAKLIAKKIDVECKFVLFERPGELADAVDKDLWDIGNIAYEPERGNTIDFSNPYVLIDANFLVKDNSNLSKNFINNLEDTLKKYQILINQIISARYANNLVQDVDLDLIKKAKLIKNGFNNNEVLLIKKIQKNKGFFEKFFDFFS